MIEVTKLAESRKSFRAGFRIYTEVKINTCAFKILPVTSVHAMREEFENAHGSIFTV